MRVYDEMLGMVVELPDQPHRIVSLAPDITEILFRLGLGDRVVGISLYCQRPRGQLEHLPRVGAYLKVSMKRLSSLQPDLILATSGAQRETARTLAREGYPVLLFPVPLSFWGILENMRRLGALLGVEHLSQNHSHNLMTIFSRLRRSLPPLRVYWEVDLGGPITAGRFSYVHDVLHWLGLVNVYHDRPESYFQPDDRETLARNPDFILYEPRKSRKDPSYWESSVQSRLGPNIPVVVLPHDSLAHYGPGLVDEVLPDIVKKVPSTIRSSTLHDR